MPTRGRGRAVQVVRMPMRGRSWSRDRRFPAIGESINTRAGKDMRR